MCRAWIVLKPGQHGIRSRTEGASSLFDFMYKARHQESGSVPKLLHLLRLSLTGNQWLHVEQLCIVNFHFSRTLVQDANKVSSGRE